MLTVFRSGDEDISYHAVQMQTVWWANRESRTGRDL